MDRQDQTTDGKFEGGIFSRMVMEENEAGQDSPEPHYFNYASVYMEKQKPLEKPPAEEAFKEIPESLGEGEPGDSKEAGVSGKARITEEPEFSEVPRFSKVPGGSERHEYEKKPKPGQEAGAGYGYQYIEDGACRCRNCPNRQKSGQTVLVVISLTAVAALAIAFLIAVFGLVTVSLWKAGRPTERTADAVANAAADGEKRTYFGEETPKKGLGDKYGEIPLPGTEGAGEYYGEIADAIRTDLNYSIEWKNYEYEGNSDKVTIAVDYPVIEGNVPNLEVINDMIDDETEYFEEYYAEYSKYMMPEESFLVYSEGFVTFMDPEVMSVVFCEMIYTDYWTDYGLYCLNIDMENGVVLDNSSIMDIDDEFAVDFRKRCRQQNGSVSDLDSMTDQEIVHYLTSGGTSILFYTPLGMEVGLNMGEYYVTVTYQDYEKYLQKY